ncbi:MAG: class I tRNA ligase family protein, partial [Coriobacteriia bacterium]|nr:class I tRNA ligase family protein [Coriobacteriia bacterium]
FLLANLTDYDGLTDRVEWAEMPAIDRWMMARLMQLMQAVDQAYESNRFHMAYRLVYSYIVNDLSAVYLDVIKDRLYSEAPKSMARRSAQVVLEHILETLVRQLAPILSFTCDEVWEHYPEGLRYEGRPEFVLLAGWPVAGDFAPQPTMAEAEALLADFKVVLGVRDIVTKALEEARLGGQIGKSQEAGVHLELPPEAYAVCKSLPAGTLEELFIVAEVFVFQSAPESPVVCVVGLASGDKCPRCWNVRELGQDADHPDVCERCAAVLTELGL